MASTVIRGAQIKDSTVQRHDLDTSTVGQAVVAKIIQGSGITLSSTGGDSGTGDVTVSGVSAVSTDAGNQSKLGSDSLIYTPGGINGFVSKTAAYTLTLADRNKYVICSGGSWTLTLPAAAAGLCFNVRNDMGISGTTGTITLQPAAGTIDGVASLALLPQQECLLICDGTNWRTFGLKREVILGTQDITTSTASASVLLPVGYRYFDLHWSGLVPVTNGTYLIGQISTDGGSTWKVNTYYHGVIGSTSATAVAYAQIENDTAFYLCPVGANFLSTPGQAKMRLYPGSATVAPTWEIDSGARNTAAVYNTKWNGFGLYNVAVQVNALKYSFASGNISNSFLTVKGVV